VERIEPKISGLDWKWKLTGQQGTPKFNVQQ
jgi:hypothetical protein